MARPFSDFINVFFWDFKRMDNTNYNFKILEILYKAKEQSQNSVLFNKPIIISLLSIIECILYDFVKRVSEHRSETIPNLDEFAISEGRGKNFEDQLETLIAYVRKHNLLRVSEEKPLYDDLDFLRKVRNRLHIQNSQNLLARDEYRVWTESNLRKTETMLERLCEVLCHVYPRPNRNFCSMSDFPRLWD